MRIGRRASEGEALSLWYGAAWYLPLTDQMYCLPIPLNQIAAGVRGIWLWFRRSHVRESVEQAKRRAYREGYEAGLLAGEQAGSLRAMRTMFAEFDRLTKVS